jgi:phenylacetate-coenzyme A ligase PaaK-like adenylate-forming protein
MDESDALSMDELVIRLAVRAGAERETAQTVTSEATRTKHVTPRIEFVSVDQIFDPSTMTKPRRIVDLRSAGGDG